MILGFIDTFIRDDFAPNALNAVNATYLLKIKESISSCT